MAQREPLENAHITLHTSIKTGKYYLRLVEN